MARPTQSLGQIKEILRLKNQRQLSVREIARSCAVPASMVGDYLKRAELAGLSWPLPEEWTQEQIGERWLGVWDAAPEVPQALPDWAHLPEELRRPSVTLRLFWQEYRQNHPAGYGYSRCCELYDRWAGTLDPVRRPVHSPGAKMFVDWAGQTLLIDTGTDGTRASVFLFVAVLGASNKTFAQAFPNQKLASWISAHVHAETFFGGVSKVPVPDHTHPAVIQACRQEPLGHTAYQEMAQHDGTVLIAQRQILAALREQKFFHGEALNSALRTKLAQLPAPPFPKRQGARGGWFEAPEKSTLWPLPNPPSVLALWEKAKVNSEDPVAVAQHDDSAPQSLLHQELDVRLTPTTGALLAHGPRVAAHARSFQPGQLTTRQEPRPKAPQNDLPWTPRRMIPGAGKVGPSCAQRVEPIRKSRPHPEMGFGSVLGIRRLGKGVAEARLEGACRRALHFDACSQRLELKGESLRKTKAPAEEPR